MAIYLDNAATTPIFPEVIEEMTSVLKDVYGNPSASHSIGRKAKGVLETGRKRIANCIGAEGSEVYFTSGGTEADNMALRCSVLDLGVKYIITSEIEHKAVLDTAKDLQHRGLCKVVFVEVDALGRPDYKHLNKLCQEHPNSLVSLMHANNEIGTLIDLKKVCEIAHNNNCYFHTDTVQTIGHYTMDVREIGMDFLSCSAHKFNGPKGVGFLFKNKNLQIKPLITGGGQEKNTRAGTENIHGIAGMAKALEMATEKMDAKAPRIIGLKKQLIQLLQKELPGVAFNGDTSEDGGLYTVLSVSLPPTELKDMLLFRLDLEGVCVSGGSACNSGAQKGSHVLSRLNHAVDRPVIRFSFGPYNTESDVINATQILKGIYTASSVQA